MDITELLSADIVLTTYDVLKEDLSHDADRHEGDRRMMRFQKRYLPKFGSSISVITDLYLVLKNGVQVVLHLMNC